MRTLFQHSFSLLQGHARDFTMMKDLLVRELKTTVPVNRGRWQSEDVSSSGIHATHELSAVTMIVSIPVGEINAQHFFKPDLPWAENHFKERVGGKPVNPPPSYDQWPYHSATERDRHIHNGHFDHTYPERFWPRHAGDYWSKFKLPPFGIRYAYGDLRDVFLQLKEDPFTRQAYLPVFFPEDTGGRRHYDGPGRVPCTLGYHFIRNGPALDCNYFIRSCDIYRHFTNDVYMAVRLTQWMVDQLLETQEMVWPGNLSMHISNLHLFRGDAWRFASA